MTDSIVSVYSPDSVLEAKHYSSNNAASIEHTRPLIIIDSNILLLNDFIYAAEIEEAAIEGDSLEPFMKPLQSEVLQFVKRLTRLDALGHIDFYLNSMIMGEICSKIFQSDFSKYLDVDNLKSLEGESDMDAIAKLTLELNPTRMIFICPYHFALELRAVLLEDLDSAINYKGLPMKIIHKNSDLIEFIKFEESETPDYEEKILNYLDHMIE